MKKLILTFVFSLFLFNSQNAFSQKVDEVTVGATIDIGRNSTGNCSRFGLCTKKIKVTIKIKVKEISSSNRIAQGAFVRDGLKENQFNTFVYNENGRLTLFLDANNFDAIKSYMNSSEYIVEEDYVFSEDEIGLKNFVVKTGKYKINYNKEKDLYFINF
jgi:hypothetical protein